MNLLLLTNALAAARRHVSEAVNRRIFDIAVGVILGLCGLVALGFLTAGGFMLLAASQGPALACFIVAGFYLIVSVIGLLVLQSIHRRRRSRANPPSFPAATPLGDVNAGGGLPAGLVSIGLLALTGYILGRITPKK